MEMASYQENLGTLEIPEDDLLTADLTANRHVALLWPSTPQMVHLYGFLAFPPTSP
ncbi:uncharacterized protein PHALS_06181 [Plasmopara halstedii]|uniref:Uncharacterized protein n=1 Tax=Plasmopara halstedii TaxID=4781 RepID=A0A0N7L7Y3_PLAHL|nr:uncharacterized protein PHALS_06181 [Plasmopara halstedii]CEG48355.1 hypothetical protein PHALS_06181 [Plasmopara halstedii]|eukprot:XP_024584724.1 hypothetical protein PHALS_06181 [Plasmopara halstedii]